MLSVSSVSNVNFRGIDLERRGSFDGGKNILSNDVPSKEKKSSAGVKVLGGVVALAALTAAVWAAPKYLSNIFDAGKDLTKSEGFKKVLDYPTTYIAKAGKWLDENLFSFLKRGKAEELVDEVKEAVD